jgi:hypothetical protein
MSWLMNKMFGATQVYYRYLHINSLILLDSTGLII